MSGPYRERPKLMLCPRCGEILDHAFDAVRICLRCEGVWMGTISIQKAFGDRRWPEGQNTWWRNAVPCPECAMDGVSSIMNAAMVGHVMIDRCYHHGLWLDHGELGRLMGGVLADDRGDDDLAALRERLHVVETEFEQLLKRRDAWRAEAEMRQRSSEGYSAWLAGEQESRLVEREDDTEDRAKQEAERTRRAQEAEQARQDAEIRRAEEKRAEDALAERQRIAADRAKEQERLRNAKRMEREKELQRLGEIRAHASSRVGRIEEALVRLRGELHDRELELHAERTRLRTAEKQLEELEAKHE